MSFKYQHLLLSTCFTAIGFVSLPANAGFEWTPPKEEIKAPLVVTEDLVPVSPEVVLSDEIMPEIINIDQKEDEIILDELVIEEVIEEEIVLSDEITPEIINIDQKEDEIILDELVVEEVVLDSVVVESQDDAEIDLFPISSGNENTVDAGDIVILSSDPDEDMSEAIVIEDEVTVIPNDEITWNKNQSFDVIEGFGTDMPLALALSQIVPAKYAYSFGNGVNPGALISWNGGKPWNEVLQDSLSSLDVDFEIKGKKIILNIDAPAVIPVIEKEAAVNVSVENEIEMANVVVKKKLKIS